MDRTGVRDHGIDGEAVAGSCIGSRTGSTRTRHAAERRGNARCASSAGARDGRGATGDAGALMRTQADIVAQSKRLVVKVGSSLVTDEGRGLDHQAWRAGQPRSRRSGPGREVCSSRPAPSRRGEAPGLEGASVRHPRATGRRCRRQMDSCRRTSRRSRRSACTPRRSCSPRRPRGPAALSQRALDAADAAAPRRDSRHQRERHRHHRRDPVRDNDTLGALVTTCRSRCAGALDRPAGPLHGGSAQGPGRNARGPRQGGDPALEPWRRCGQRARARGMLTKSSPRSVRRAPARRR